MRPQNHPPHPPAGSAPASSPRVSCRRCITRETASSSITGGRGASHRSHDQRHPRLRHRPTHHKSRRTTQDRLCGQPTSPRRDAPVTTVSSAKLASRAWKDPSPSTTTVPRRCASPIRAFKPFFTSCSCSSSSRAPSPTSREHVAPLLGQKPSQTDRDGSPTICVAYVIERIPKAHRYRITAKGLRTALFSSTPGSIPARCDPALAIISTPIQASRWPTPFAPPKPRINTWYRDAKIAA
jgi:hypothetical protein